MFAFHCVLVSLTFLFVIFPFRSCSVVSAVQIIAEDSLTNIQEGQRLFKIGSHDEAANHFWSAILKYEKTFQSIGVEHSLQDIFHSFLQCFAVRDRIIDGFIYVGRESLMRKQPNMAETYINEALKIDSENKEALALQRALKTFKEYPIVSDDGAVTTTKGNNFPDSHGGRDSFLLAEQKFNTGIHFFNQKKFQLASGFFDEACNLSEGQHHYVAACTNAVYCRANTLDWGLNGTQFAEDMARIEEITWREIISLRKGGSKITGTSTWTRSTSVHPHMVLGYPVDPVLKYFISESHAFMDEPLARYDGETGSLKQLPSHLPYDVGVRREKTKADYKSKDTFKIRVGFVSSGFKSKAVMFLSHAMFQFFDKDKFEVHIVSAGGPDNPRFISDAMRGVDWRENVRKNVDYFHDVQDISNDHIALAKFIHDLDVHILVEWDGYARSGDRAQGLFALRPAPVQILHQEFLGTMGGHFDYIITDKITSPEDTQNLYSEKMIYMPNHFFSKAHAIMRDVKDPSYDFKPKKTEYVYGTGSPQENRCLSSLDIGPKEASFVFCNFNKFLKNNPETVISYIQILRNVPDSILCLLENPTEGIPNLRKFVNDFASDGSILNERIHFLPWAANPFDHQMRSQDFCNIVLDSYPYNGHTTAQDALYGGVPIVTRSDGLDMSSRVSTSANVVLCLEELNAYDGPSQYVEIATKLGTNKDYFQAIRNKLIGTCLQREPMHPYWDVARYVFNFSEGIVKAFETFIYGNEVSHIEI